MRRFDLVNVLKNGVKTGKIIDLWETEFYEGPSLYDDDNHGLSKLTYVWRIDGMVNKLDDGLEIAQVWYIRKKTKKKRELMYKGSCAFFSLNPLYTITGKCTRMPKRVKREVECMINDIIGYKKFLELMQGHLDFYTGMSGIYHRPFPEFENDVRDLYETLRNDITSKPDYRFKLP